MVLDAKCKRQFKCGASTSHRVCESLMYGYSLFPLTMISMHLLFTVGKKLTDVSPPKMKEAEKPFSAMKCWATHRWGNFKRKIGVKTHKTRCPLVCIDPENNLELNWWAKRREKGCGMEGVAFIHTPPPPAAVIWRVSLSDARPPKSLSVYPRACDSCMSLK